MNAAPSFPADRGAGSGDEYEEYARAMAGDSAPAVTPADVAPVPANDAPAPCLLRSAAEIAGDAQCTSWLLRPILERKALVLVFGTLGSLKSFLTLHWGLQVAEQGERVIYLHAEGRGLWKRLRAWAIRRHPDRHWRDTLAALPFHAVERPLNLSVDAVVARLQDEIAQLGSPPALIIVDTLSRNSDGTVERSNEDAQVYLNRLDGELRARYGATVVLVHHPGHGSQDRSRGPYTLMASTDAWFRVERPDLSSLQCVVYPGRLKDDPSGQPIVMVGDVTDVGEVDEDGAPITSLAMRATTDPPAAPPRAMGRNQERAVTALREWARTHEGSDHVSSEDMRDLLTTHGIGRQRRPEVLKFLTDAGLITSAVAGFTLHRGML